MISCCSTNDFRWDSLVTSPKINLKFLLKLKGATDVCLYVRLSKIVTWYPFLRSTSVKTDPR